MFVNPGPSHRRHKYSILIFDTTSFHFWFISFIVKKEHADMKMICLVPSLLIKSIPGGKGNGTQLTEMKNQNR